MIHIIQAKDIVATVLLCPTCGADVTSFGPYMRCCNHDASTFEPCYRTADGSYYMDARTEIIYEKC